MAGGRTPRHGGRTLAERGLATPGGTAHPSPAGGPPASPALPRHVWVVDFEMAPGQWPGLLLEWRKFTSDGGWQGRAVLAVPGEDGPVMLESWIPAHHLKPAPGSVP